MSWLQDGMINIMLTALSLTITSAKQSPYCVPDILRVQPAWHGMSHRLLQANTDPAIIIPTLLTNWNRDEGVERGTGLKGGGILEEAMVCRRGQPHEGTEVAE